MNMLQALIEQFPMENQIDLRKKGEAAMGTDGPILLWKRRKAIINTMQEGYNDTGPHEWLLNGKQWLCLTDRELMIALVPPMIQHWGKELPKGAGYFDGLSKMTDAIPRQDELPSTSLETPALEAPCEFTDLELV